MLYLTGATNFRESLEIAATLGFMPPAIVRPPIAPNTVLALEPIQRFAFGEKILLLAPHTASWCLLDGFEAAVAEQAKTVSFGLLGSRYPGVDQALFEEFFIRLFQRGLLRLDGKPGLRPDIVRDGALYREANLVEILITQKCNLACPYCLAEAGQDMPHLHPEIAYRAVDEAFRLRDDIPLAIQLSGGEPFVNFGLFKQLVAYIETRQQSSGRDVTVVTQTNGTLINDEIAEFIKTHKVGVGVSIDGPGYLHDRSRPMLGGRPSHERAVRGIRTLIRHGIKFGTILVLSRVNVGHPEEIADYFVELGIRSTKINPISMIGDAQRAWNELAITSDEYYEFLNRFIDHIVQAHLPLREANLAEYLKYLVRRTHNYRCMRSNCGAGTSFFLVDAKGDVYPCAHSAGIPDWRIGTIQDANGDLVGMGKQNAIVDQFQKRRVERVPSMGSCPWRHFCEGGCAVNAYQQFGTILAPDVLCAFYERMYPRLFEILATDSERFQTLLDLTFTPGQAEVVSFCLTPQGPTDATPHRKQDKREVVERRHRFRSAVN